jgi:D-alanyl-D-alanine carboxypeptidase (penicillin-binding protein 5/6)
MNWSELLRVVGCSLLLFFLAGNGETFAVETGTGKTSQKGVVPKAVPVTSLGAKPSSGASVSSKKPGSAVGAVEGISGAPVNGAVAHIVVDARTGTVLSAKNADARRPVASTQKLLTALLVAERGGLLRKVTIEKSDTLASPTKLNMEVGDEYRRDDLLRILLVKSMNDVACALARDHSGSVSAFARVMNAKAAELGMTRSRFVNPNGLPAEGQYSTARDMSKLALAAYRNADIRKYVKLRTTNWLPTSGLEVTYENTNKVLGMLPACNGMKTGYTDAAKFCLVSSAKEGGSEVIAVVLGDSKPAIWEDSRDLLAWGLRQKVSR